MKLSLWVGIFTGIFSYDDLKYCKHIHIFYNNCFSTVKFNKNLHVVSKLCVFLQLYKQCVIVSDDHVCLHCIKFLFCQGEPGPKITFGLAKVTAGGVNTDSKNGLDRSFWNHRWARWAVLKSWLKPCLQLFCALKNIQNFFSLQILIVGQFHC